MADNVCVIMPDVGPNHYPRPGEWQNGLWDFFHDGTAEERDHSPRQVVGHPPAADLRQYDTVILSAHDPEWLAGLDYAQRLRNERFAGRIILVHRNGEEGMVVNGRDDRAEINRAHEKGIVNALIQERHLHISLPAIVVQQTNERRAEIKEEQETARKKAEAEHDPSKYPELRSVIGIFAGDIFTFSDIRQVLDSEKRWNRHYNERTGTIPPYNLRLENVKKCDILLIEWPDDTKDAAACTQSLKQLRKQGFRGKIALLEPLHDILPFLERSEQEIAARAERDQFVDAIYTTEAFRQNGMEVNRLAGLGFARQLEKERSASFKEWPLERNVRRLGSDEKLWPERLRLSDAELEGLGKAVKRKALAPIKTRPPALNYDHIPNFPRFHYAAFANELQGEWDAHLQGLLEAKGRWKDGKPRPMTDDEAKERDAERDAHAKDRLAKKSADDEARRALDEKQAQENHDFDRRRWAATVDQRPYRYHNMARLEYDRTRLGMRGFTLEQEVLERAHKRRPIVAAGQPLSALKPAERRDILARDPEWQKHQAQLAALEAEYALRDKGGREESYGLDDHEAGRAPYGAPVDLRLHIERPTQQDKDHTERLLKERDEKRPSNPGGPGSRF